MENGRNEIGGRQLVAGYLGVVLMLIGGIILLPLAALPAFWHIDGYNHPGRLHKIGKKAVRVPFCAVEPHPVPVGQHGHHHKYQPHPAEKQHDASV